MQRLDRQRSAAKSNQIPLDLSSERWCGAQSSVRKPGCIQTPPELWKGRPWSQVIPCHGRVKSWHFPSRTELYRWARWGPGSWKGWTCQIGTKSGLRSKSELQFWIFVSGAVRRPPNPLLHSASRWLLPTATRDPHLRTLWLQKHAPLCTGQTRSVKSAWDQELM